MPLLGAKNSAVACLETIYFFYEALASNDIMFSIQVGFYANSVSVTSEEIYCVTERVGSLATQNSEAVLRCRIDAAKRFNSFIAENLIRTPKLSAVHLSLLG